MPFVDHNDSWIREAIERETEETRDLLQKLRHLVEQGHINEPPLQLVTELGRHAGLLSNLIKTVTIRHDFVDDTGRTLYSEYEEIFPFVDNQVRQDPRLLSAPVLHPSSSNEYQIYRDLGFSEQEYKDLLTATESFNKHPFDLTAAFDAFSIEIVRELQCARYSIKLPEVISGVSGIVGISVYTVAFLATAGAAVPALVGSCATGITAIAVSFPEVRRKLLQRGH